MSGVGGFGHEKETGARLLGMQLLWEERLWSLNEDASLCSLCICLVQGPGMLPACKSKYHCSREIGETCVLVSVSKEAR